MGKIIRRRSRRSPEYLKKENTMDRVSLRERARDTMVVEVRDKIKRVGKAKEFFFFYKWLQGAKIHSDR